MWYCIIDDKILKNEKPYYLVPDIEGCVPGLKISRTDKGMFIAKEGDKELFSTKIEYKLGYSPERDFLKWLYDNSPITISGKRVEVLYKKE